MTKVPHIMTKVLHVMTKVPHIMNEAPHIVTINHLRQSWHSIFNPTRFILDEKNSGSHYINLLFTWDNPFITMIFNQKRLALKADFSPKHGLGNNI